MSIRGFSRFGSSFSVSDASTGVSMADELSIMNCLALGSSFSIRFTGSLGSCMSAFGKVTVGNMFSILDMVRVGSSLSLRAV